jgi:hypothetical protein
MPITIIVIEAVTEKLAPDGKVVVGEDGKAKLTGCGACIRYEEQIREKLEALAAASNGKISAVVSLKQVSMKGPRCLRMPNALRIANPGWFPCILAADTNQWNATEFNPDAPLDFKMYNGEQLTPKDRWTLLKNAPLNAESMYAWATMIEQAMSTAVQPARKRAAVDMSQPSNQSSIPKRVRDLAYNIVSSQRYVKRQIYPL